MAITYFEAPKLCSGCVGPPGLCWKEEGLEGELLGMGISLGKGLLEMINNEISTEIQGVPTSSGSADLYRTVPKSG